MQDDESDHAIAGGVYLALLRRVIIRISGLTRDLMQPLDLTPPQAIALLTVHEREGLTQVSLVKAMESDANTISGLVRRLEQRGLVTRERRENDARAVRLSLTEQGHQLAVEAQLAFDTLAEALGDTVPKRSGATIAKWLKEILTIHEL